MPGFISSIRQGLTMQSFIGLIALLAVFFFCGPMAFAESPAPDWSANDDYTYQNWEFNALNIDELHCPKEPGDPTDIPPGIPGRDIEFLEPDAIGDEWVNTNGVPKLIHADVPDGIFGTCAHFPPYGSYDRCGYYGGMAETSLLFEIPVDASVCEEKELWVQWIAFVINVDESRLVEAGKSYTKDTSLPSPPDRVTIGDTDEIEMTGINIKILEGEGNQFGEWCEYTARFLISGNTSKIFIKLYNLSEISLIDSVMITTSCVGDIDVPPEEEPETVIYEPIIIDSEESNISNLCQFISDAGDHLDLAAEGINHFNLLDRMQARVDLRKAYSEISHAQMALAKMKMLDPMLGLMQFVLNQVMDIKTKEEIIGLMKEMPAMMPMMFGMMPMVIDPMKDAIPLEFAMMALKVSIGRSLIRTRGIFDQDAIRTINKSKNILNKLSMALCK